MSNDCTDLVLCRSQHNYPGRSVSVCHTNGNSTIPRLSDLLLEIMKADMQTEEDKVNKVLDTIKNSGFSVDDWLRCGEYLAAVYYRTKNVAGAHDKLSSAPMLRSIWPAALRTVFLSDDVTVLENMLRVSNVQPDSDNVFMLSECRDGGCMPAPQCAAMLRQHGFI